MHPASSRAFDAIKSLASTPPAPTHLPALASTSRRQALNRDAGELSDRELEFEP